MSEEDPPVQGIIEEEVVPRKRRKKAKVYSEPTTRRVTRQSTRLAQLLGRNVADEVQIPTKQPKQEEQDAGQQEENMQELPEEAVSEPDEVSYFPMLPKSPFLSSTSEQNVVKAKEKSRDANRISLQLANFPELMATPPPGPRQEMRAALNPPNMDGNDMFLLSMGTYLPSLKPDPHPLEKETDQFFRFLDRKNKTAQGYKCTFTDLKEGQIGKVSIHKSGKMRMTLGEVTYCIFDGDVNTELDEVVSLSVDHDVKSATACNLGILKKRLQAIPDMFLKQTK